ncbi:MAG: SH3 domain-containing protein [Bacteroidaceae bacterium]|nr:SH3 domain-containing protein [Bacteroidaceae bacterium]
MKRFLLLLAVVLTTSLCAMAQQRYGRVVDPDGYTNIRKGPGTNYAIVRRYQSGEYLYYTPLSNGWSKVYSANKSSSFMGYMATSRIRYVNPNAGSATSTSLRKGTVVDPRDTYVNIRKGPGTNYAITGQLAVGSDIHYKPYNSGWVKVYEFERFLGYVAKSRIR